MDVYVTEEQQWESIKKWFDKHGNTITWVLLIVLSIISATMYWRHHQRNVNEQASEVYMNVVDALNKEDAASIKTHAQTLMKDFSSSSYATFGALAKAFTEAEEKDYANAEKTLDWVLKNSKQSDFKALARLRLMRLYYAQNKFDEALKLYDEKMAGEFLTLMAEIKGDILLKQNKLMEAKEAYLKAYLSAPEVGMYGPTLKMKMEDLGMEIPQKPKQNEKHDKNEAKA